MRSALMTAAARPVRITRRGTGDPGCGYQVRLGLTAVDGTEEDAELSAISFLLQVSWRRPMQV